MSSDGAIHAQKSALGVASDISSGYLLHYVSRWDTNVATMAKKLPPIHPGEILREEFLVPLKLTPYAVAAALHVPRTRIERIAREEKPVTADTALRLGKFFKTGAAFWMNIQARFDLETAEDVLAPQIKKIASYEAA
jgi:addiction module HigA family antidote